MPQDYGAIPYQSPANDYGAIPYNPTPVFPQQFQTPGYTPEILQEPDGFLKQAWNTIWTPLSDIGTRAANKVNELSRIGDDYSYGTNDPTPAGQLPSEKLISFGGSLVDNMTAPGNLAFLGAGAVRGAALSSFAEAPTAFKAGTANLANKAIQAMSVPVAGKGAYDLMADDSSLVDRGLGAANLAMGAIGMHSSNKYQVRNPVVSDMPVPGGLTKAIEGEVMDGDILGNSPLRPSPPVDPVESLVPQASKPAKIIFNESNNVSLDKLNNALKEGYVRGPIEDGWPTMVLPSNSVQSPNEVTTSIKADEPVKNEGKVTLYQANNQLYTDPSQIPDDAPSMDVLSFMPDDKGIQEASDYFSNSRKNIKRAIQEFSGSSDDSDVLDEPQFARTSDGKLAIGADIKSLGKVLGTSLYKGDIATIATKELLQNSIDAIRHLGSNGKITVDFTAGQKTVPDSIVVKDNGKGLNRQELESIFTDLGASGKRDDENAIGGFGLAKAAPLLGGKSVIVRSVVSNSLGSKTQHTFKGTPDELLDGVDIQSESVPRNTPTGMSVEVFLPESSDLYGAQRYVNSLGKYTKLEGKISNRYNYHDTKSKYSESDYDRIFNYDDIESSQNEAHVITVSNPSADAHISIPEGSEIGTHHGITLILRNKGMYQNAYTKWLNGSVDGIPDTVIVDIDAKVPEGSNDYPFVANRESLRGTIEEDVNNYIDEHIIKPALDKSKQGLQSLYDNIPFVDTGNNQIYYHDTGSKEDLLVLKEMMNTFTMKDLGDQVAHIVLSTLGKMGEAKWDARLERTGIIFDEGLRGVHIPNPTTKKSMILINPLQMMGRLNPDEASAGFVHTILHEVAHVEPSDRGHDEPFAVRLANIHEKFAGKATIDAYREFLAAVTEPTGEYTAEVQDLLQRYNEARGREATKDDALTRTGVKSKVTDSGSGSDDGNIGSDGTGIVRSKHVDEFDRLMKQLEGGSGGSIPPNEPPLITGGSPEDIPKPVPPKQIQQNVTQDKIPDLIQSVVNDSLKVQNDSSLTPAKRESLIRAAIDFNRTVLTAFDMSAPLRQGLGLIYRKEWWTSLDDMFKVWGSQKAYDNLMDSINNHPSGLFRPSKEGVIKNGRAIMDRSTGMAKLKEVKPYAERVGLVLTDMMGHNEENFRSKYAERYVPGIKMSNRAFVGFLNKLRSDVFVAMINHAMEEGKDPLNNLVLGEQIANFINNATGRGTLKFSVPRVEIGGKLLVSGDEYDLEGATKALAEVFFAPRLLASRINTYTQVLNPKFYTTLDPTVRKESLKSLMAIVGFGALIGGLLKESGLAEVNYNPFNSDFGKIKIGSSRYDLFGGHQQLFVAAARITPIIGGYSVSSMTGRTTDLSAGGYGKTNRQDILQNFFTNKLSPLASFVWAWMGNEEFDGTPFNVKDALAHRTVPIVLQDLQEIYKDDPAMVGKDAWQKLMETPGAITRDPMGIPMMIPPYFGAGIQTYGR